MRIEEITENEAHQVIITVSASRNEANDSNALNAHQKCQIVKGSSVADLLDEAARRLQNTDYGHIWSMGFGCADIAKQLRKERITI